MSKYLSRAAILATQEFKTEEVEVPEWGGTVLVRELSAVEVNKIGVGMVSVGEGGASADDVDLLEAVDMFPAIVAYSVIDGNGDHVFSEDDVRSLPGSSKDAIQRIVAVAFRLSGLGEDEDEEEEEGEPKNE